MLPTLPGLAISEQSPNFDYQLNNLCKCTKIHLVYYYTIFFYIIIKP